jgi:hypothetical protein
MFIKNVGGIDRIARVVLGLALIIVGFFVIQGTVGIIIGIIGFIPLATSVIGFCPAYLPFNISTNKEKK